MIWALAVCTYPKQRHAYATRGSRRSADLCSVRSAAFRTRERLPVINHQDTKAAIDPLIHQVIDSLKKKRQVPSMSQWINDPMSQFKKPWARDVDTLPLDNAPPMC